MKVSRDRALNIALALGALVALAVGAILAEVVKVVIAVAVAYLVLRIGLGLLRGLAQPVPEPPEPGELRKVKIEFRCSICGAEVRMTIAPHEDPEAPRHCGDDMDLVAPIE